jgi:hypothetical protein
LHYGLLDSEVVQAANEAGLGREPVQADDLVEERPYLVGEVLDRPCPVPEKGIDCAAAMYGWGRPTTTRRQPLVTGSSLLST